MTSIFDWGEIIQCDVDKSTGVSLGVVLRSDGPVVRFRVIAARFRGKTTPEWRVPKDPSASQDILLVLGEPGQVVRLVAEADAVQICADALRTPDVAHFRAWWSGKAVGRR